MKDKIGFTLVEILIVTVIAGTLFSFGLPYYRDYIEKAKATQGIVGLLPYKKAIGICASKHSGFDKCNQGQYGIPDGFIDFNSIVNGEDESEISGLQAVFVSKGIVTAYFSTYGNTDNSSDFIVVLSPSFNSNNSVIVWKAGCSIAASEILDFC